jgi:UDP-GlcNAc:undecaprenyl-phosphate/decaprenyl-phosphate GlcNAc-1-phosphate transferase
VIEKISFLFLFLLNLIIYLNHKKLSLVYDLFDVPDGKRKKHKRPIALTGGLIIFLNFFLSILIINESLEVSYFFLIFIFLLGYIDDKYDLKPLIKLFIIFILVIINSIIDQNILISVMRFDFIRDIYINGIVKYFFIAFCIVTFVNALNMFDGANLQTSIYCIFIFTLLFFKNSNFIYLVIIASLLSFSLLNYKNLSFLGDSGSMLLGYLIAIEIIKNYNANTINNCEEIFLIMFLPGVDMLRLFIVRILSRQNPFKADNRHIHHLLIKKYGKFKSLVLVLTMSVLPFILSLIVSSFFSIIVSLLVYIFIISSTKIKSIC